MKIAASAHKVLRLVNRGYATGKFHHTIHDKRRRAHDLEAHDLFQIGDFLELVRSSERLGSFVGHGGKFLTFGTTGAEDLDSFHGRKEMKSLRAGN